MWVSFGGSISILGRGSEADGEADGWLLEEDGSNVDVVFKGSRGKTKKESEAISTYFPKSYGN